MLTKILNIVVLLTTMLCANAVNAGDLEDGYAAYYKKNYALAFVKFKQAAAQGQADAHHSVGIMYEKGQGVVQDYAEAVKWYKLEAAQGGAFGQYALGNMYSNGQGVSLNPKKNLRGKL